MPHNDIKNLSRVNKQKQSLAPPPHQAKADASGETTPTGPEEPQKESPMEQEPSEEEPKSESTSEVKGGEEEDVAESTTMPEPPSQESEGSSAAQEQ